VTWGVGQGLYVIGQANREKLVDQARRVNAWTIAFDDRPQDLFREAFGQVPYAQYINLTHTSKEAMYEVVAHLVWVQGNAPRTGEAIESPYRSPHRDVRVDISLAVDVRPGMTGARTDDNRER
jgi:hypothetical protein